MKKTLKLCAVLLALGCLLALGACDKKEPDAPANTTPTPSTQQPDPQVPVTQPEQPQKDPKDELLEQANENKEELLAVMSSVVETYRGADLPEYYAKYPAKLGYPKLESADDITLEKGDDSCDLLINAKIDEVTLTVSVKHIEGGAEGSSPWMVVKTAFSGVKG